MSCLALSINSFSIVGTSDDPSDIIGYRQRLKTPVRTPFDYKPFDALKFQPEAQQFMLKVEDSTLYIQTQLEPKNIHVYIKRFNKTTVSRMILLGLVFILDLEIPIFSLFVEQAQHELVSGVLFTEFGTYIDSRTEELDLIFEVFCRKRRQMIYLAGQDCKIAHITKKQPALCYDLYYEDSQGPDTVRQWFVMQKVGRVRTEIHLVCASARDRDAVAEKLRVLFPDVRLDTID